MNLRVLLLTPPLTQLNTPYPATAYLKGFLNKHGFEVDQADPAIELIIKLFSRKNLIRMKEQILKRPEQDRREFEFFFAHFDQYLCTVEPVIRFLQGKDPSLALRIVSRHFLPEGPRFVAVSEGAQPDDPDPISWAFGMLGVQDRAKYLASLYIDDLGDIIQKGIDPKFTLSRYAEKLAASVPTFDPLLEALQSSTTLVDEYLEEITLEHIRTVNPDVVGITAPFPGNVYGAFRMAKAIKNASPQTLLILGGGYVNTELRDLSDPRVFDFFDFLTLDDGERPFLSLLESIQNSEFFRSKKRGALQDLSPRHESLTMTSLFNSHHWVRTLVRENHQVVLKNNPALHDIPHRDAGTPSYQGLKLDQYLSLFEMLNPVHRIWSDGRWNKLTLAHGCYWKKCNFCDISLDYINRYDPASADLLVDRIEQIIQQTGQTGFHFVDEAAPPAVLKAMAERLLQRGVSITWWGNVRFDKTFTPELTSLLARSGCVAVTGGLEVASDRLLKLMQKGVTVEQVARVAHAFSQAGVMVHAYLMYGFPTQTEQETIDALERVRQLFLNGCIQSGYWHRFSATAHSPIGKTPEKFGIKILETQKPSFARNDLEFEDPTGTDHDRLGEALKKAIYNYMHGAGLDLDVRVWFGMKGKKFLAPTPQVHPRLVERSIAQSIYKAGDLEA
ncbi:radical SAM protein [bacterium]|nr:radical SAM protein [bacterium]